MQLPRGREIGGMDALPMAWAAGRTPALLGWPRQSTYTSHTLWSTPSGRSNSAESSREAEGHNGGWGWLLRTLPRLLRRESCQSRCRKPAIALGTGRLAAQNPGGGGAPCRLPCRLPHLHGRLEHMTK